MTVEDYGVWVGYPIDFHAETDDDTPHLQLRFSEDAEALRGSIRAAVNIKSSTREESRLVYWVDRDFKHPITDSLPSQPGFYERSNNGYSLDYIRDNLFNIRDGTILPHNIPGDNNDIIDMLSPILDQAINEKATIYIFGSRFTRGEAGIHNVHMNQGNDGKFRKFNGIHQDGGILLHFPDSDHWEGIFLAFGVQKPHTNEDGDPIGKEDFVDVLEGTRSTFPSVSDEPPTVADGTLFLPLSIRAALLNPVGPDQDSNEQPETIYIFNKSTRPIDLTGFSILNRGRAQQFLKGEVAGQSSKAFLVPNAPLSNNGGTISLLNKDGLKIDGVSYTKAQAKREGQFVYFGRHQPA